MVENSKTPLIEFKHVSKTFKGTATTKEVHAVHDVSISVDRGEIFGVIGYSGAGKSTLIRMINGLENPTEGSVKVDNQDITQLKKAPLAQLRHKIGMIFQNYNLLKTATIYQNITIPLKLEKIPKDEIEQRAEKYLKIVGLWDRRNSYPSQLSGGQSQRVAVARALAHEPTILLSDEATSALDPETTSSILDLLKDINQKLGLTIFIITHELDVVKSICDKVAIMEAGNVVEQGRTIDVFTGPKKEVTRQFLGSNDLAGVPASLLVETEKHNHVLLIKFIGNEASLPVIAQLTKKFGVEPNIMAGSIEYLKEQPYGKLVISIENNDQYDAEIQYLKDQGVIVEEVG
ncbi:methionine ABC transporter ATP-binding protein [Secundilactobacillus hailunensis]|uniref:Methionine ABC transporter ATP-binding protein n=1 Tax=Secundilactobacillus hailunensis TaxID=2559923 RepID=A0ABW1T8H7_9LACO|nr:methionine ABC transporter ATP-binding protein [Secundilactobacillus hailunensis]